jgi:(2S)-methylsuccinyl-CoA dehydrogenase
VAGALNAERLDAEQIVSYQLGLSGAELLAADAALQAVTPASSDLALTYAAEAIASVGERLEQIALALDWDSTPLAATLAGSELRALRMAIIGSPLLSMQSDAWPL